MITDFSYNLASVHKQLLDVDCALMVTAVSVCTRMYVYSQIRFPGPEERAQCGEKCLK